MRAAFDLGVTRRSRERSGENVNRYESVATLDWHISFGVSFEGTVQRALTSLDT